MRHGGRRPDAEAVVDTDLDYDAGGVGNTPLYDGGERVRLDRDDLRYSVPVRVRAARCERGEGAQAEQNESS
jgi:hypothetical protein